MKRLKANIIDFFVSTLPSAFFISIVLHLILSDGNLEIFGFAGEWIKDIYDWLADAKLVGGFIETVKDMFSAAVSEGWLWGLVMVPLAIIATLFGISIFVIAIDIAYILLVLATAVGVVVIPFCMLDGNLGAESIFIWISCIMFVWTSFCAFYFSLGSFLPDSTYVSGHHIEVSYDGYGTATVRDVAEYSGGGEFFINIIILLFRFLRLIILGAPIFIIRNLILLFK